MYPYTPTPSLLQNRTILITGAGQGIGKAVAIACASLGAKLLLLGRTQSKLEKLSQQITQQSLISPIILPFDLETAKTEDYIALTQSLTKQIGRLDGLLHNAAIATPLKSIIDLTDQEFTQVMQINVNATFSLTHHLLPLLQLSNDASIIFTSSTVGRKGRKLWGAYATSKFAVEGLMQCLAEELTNTPVRANSVNPGATRTAMRAAIYPQENPNQLPTPEDIIPLYLYLLGPDSKGVNGQALNAQ